MSRAGHRVVGRDQLARAVAVLEDARTLCAKHHEQWMHFWALLFLGLAAFIDDQVDLAKALCRDGLARKRALDDLLGTGVAVEFLAWTALAARDTERAAKLLGASTRLSEPLGAHLGGFQRLLDWHDQYTQQARSALGARAFDGAFNEGHNLHLDSHAGKPGLARTEPSTRAHGSLNSRGVRRLSRRR